MDYIDKEEKELIESYNHDEWSYVSKSKKARILYSLTQQIPF